MALLADVGLTGYEHLSAGELPYGRKRALEIATTMAMEPQMMLLDEPTAGMTHEDVDRIVALVKRVAVGRTVLLVEHNLKVVSGLCDTITVLARGRCWPRATTRPWRRTPTSSPPIWAAKRIP